MAQTNKKSAQKKPSSQKTGKTAQTKKKSPAGSKPAAAASGKKQDRGGDPSMMRHQLAPYILGLIAVFLVICFLVSDSTGFIGGSLKKLLFGLFSTAAWAVPALLVNLGIFWKRYVASGSLR